MALTRTKPGRSSIRTAARNRRALHLRRIAETAGGSFRIRLWALNGWLMAEAMATPADEREQFLYALRIQVEDINERRSR